MRRLVPDHRELPLQELYGGLTLGEDVPTSRPWLAIGMVSTVDGAASIDGDTATLGSVADAQAFRQLRAACDAILVGAGTVRDEVYGPPVGTAARRSDRRRRGLQPVPRLVVVSRRLRLDPGHRVFRSPEHRPIVVTTAAAPAGPVRRLLPVADVLRIGHEEVDLPAMLAHLATLGLTRILSEGGPTLNGELLAGDLVDELFVTVAPVAVGGDAPRIARGPTVAAPRALELVSAFEHAGELLLRYRRPRMAT